MLGAGWSITGTPTAPQAVVALIKVPWDRANEALAVDLLLTDEDGRAVALAGPDGAAQPVRMATVLEVGRPPGMVPGSLIDAAWVLNLAPMPLPGGRYEWRLQISDQHFLTVFQVQSPPAPPQPPAPR